MARHVACLAAAVWAFFACSALAQEAPTRARTEAWRADIETARTDFLPRDRSYSPAHRARADAALRRLALRADRLSDAQIEAGLAEAAALSGNAHTRAYLLRNRGVWRRYPIRIWKFGGEWRVIAARPDHADLVGARILRIGGVSVARAERTVRPLFAGNAQWARYMAAYSLTSPDALIGVDLLTGEGDARFVFSRAGRRLDVVLAPEPHVRRDSPEEAWWFLSPAHPASAGWRHILTGQALPASLTNPAAHYRFARCADGVAYLQFNRAQNMASGEDIPSFGARVLSELARDPPRRLALDLRFNTGGDLSLGGAFIRALARSAYAQDPGRILVLVGPSTFSAGITHAAQMRQDSRALLVGTPPGDRLEFWSEGGNVLLPHARIQMHYADRAHTYSNRTRGVPSDLVHLDLNIANLNPDRPVDWQWSLYAAGRDPYLELALGGPLRCGAAEAAD